MPSTLEKPKWSNDPQWNATAHELVPILRELAKTEPIWNPLPVHFAVDISPSNAFQDELLHEVSALLTDSTIGGSQRQVPDRRTPLEDRPNMIMMFGNGRVNARVNTIPTYLKLPSPKPPFLLVNTVDRLPPIGFAVARTQLVAGACNNGVIFEGPQNGAVSSGALWASMQGNYMEMRYPHPKVLDSVVLRILAHYGTIYVTERYAGEPPVGLTWENWERSPIHREVAEAAWTLGEAGLIRDRVNLSQYYDDEIHTFAIQKALNKSLGESMRAQFDPDLRVMGITVSGGGKVEVSDDPRDGHLVPVTQITPDGYVVVNPKESRVKKYGNGSVETLESGKIILFGALALGGVARTYKEAEAWLQDQFIKNGVVDIVPETLEPMITVIDHSHWHVEEYDDERVEVVSPDPRYYPPDLDFACGSLDSANATASALFRSQIFQNPGPSDDPMKGKVLVIELGGHGLIALGTDRRKVTEALTDDRVMKLRPPRWV
jgi:hypothetical protein